MLAHWNEAVPRILRAATSGPEQFDAIAAEILSFFHDDHDRARLLLRELLDRPEEIAPLVALRVQPWAKIVCDYIRKGQEQGRVHQDVDPEAYVAQVINLVLCGFATHGSIRALLVDPPADDARGRPPPARARCCASPSPACSSPHRGSTASAPRSPAEPPTPEVHPWPTSSPTTTISSTTSTRASTGARWSRPPSAGCSDEGGPATTAEAVASYRDMAEMVGRFVADEVAPAGVEIDRAARSRLKDGEAILPARHEQSCSSRSRSSICTGCACRASSAA